MFGVWYKSVNFDAEANLALEKGVPVRRRVRGIHALQERIHHLFRAEWLGFRVQDFVLGVSVKVFPPRAPWNLHFPGTHPLPVDLRVWG